MGHFTLRVTGYEAGACVHKAKVHKEGRSLLTPAKPKSTLPSLAGPLEPPWVEAAVPRTARLTYLGWETHWSLAKSSRYCLQTNPVNLLFHYVKDLLCVHTCPSRCPSRSHHSMCHTPILQPSLFAGDCVGHLSPGEEEAW